MKFKNDWKLYLDDVRPCPQGFVLARSFDEAIELIKANGCPSFISFDHDLGLIPNEVELNGHSLAKWLVEKDLDDQIIPDHFDYNIHSANSLGRDNIKGLLDQYLIYRKKGSSDV